MVRSKYLMSTDAGNEEGVVARIRSESSQADGGISRSSIWARAGEKSERRATGRKGRKKETTVARNRRPATSVEAVAVAFGMRDHKQADRA